MKMTSSVSVAILVLLMAQNASAQEETAEEKAERIQAEIEVMELERHHLVAEEKLIDIRKTVVAKRLELLAKERELAAGGVQEAVAEESTEKKPVEPPFTWGEIPELRSLGEDTSGMKASVLLASGQTAVLRIGTTLPSGASVKDITNTGVLIEKQGREMWIR